jgi:hypothetical protein
MVITWLNDERLMDNMTKGYKYFEGEVKKLWNYIHYTIKDEVSKDDYRNVINYRLVGSA